MEMHVKFTSIKRNKLSSPTKYLLKNNLLSLNKKVLDYGCGRGFDSITLNMDRYDKYWYPCAITDSYDYIICHFVLNVVSEREQRKILRHIKNLLKPTGVAYLTVRRDLKNNITYKTYTQRIVKLTLKSVYKCGKYEIYELKK